MSGIAAESILDALPNPVIVIGAGEQIGYANVAAEDFFQLSSSSLQRHLLSDLVPYASPIIHSVDKVKKTGGVVNEYAATIGTPRSGGERTVDVQTSPLPENANCVILMVLRRSMAQKFDSQLSHQGAARSVTGMAAMLAHEIKNPLAGIKGAAQLLEPAAAEPDRALTHLICNEVDRIRDLVDQMEVFSDERPIEKKPTNIHVVLDRVKQLVAAEAAPGIVFKEDYDPSLPAVFGNHDQLVQIFLNLAKNASEAIISASESGEIALTTAFRPGVRLTVPGTNEKVSLPLEVSVHDTGPGVDESILTHIFEPFVTTKRSGRGLGLALVAKLVLDHGGVIECKPRENGTTFRVLLPLFKGTDQTVERNAS
jgi:two-component system, NtrC family, nitrogen regulation sensor histidine kinase GlnL